MKIEKLRLPCDEMWEMFLAVQRDVVDRVLLVTRVKGECPICAEWTLRGRMGRVMGSRGVIFRICKSCFDERQAEERAEVGI